MGAGSSSCSRCALGNPCSDPSCHRGGSAELFKLLDKVKDSLDDMRQSLKSDSVAQEWVDHQGRSFIKKHGLTDEEFKKHSDHIRQYFNTPQPNVEDINSKERALICCMRAKRELEYLECQHAAQELYEMATTGRDPPAHCKKPGLNPLECMYRDLEKAKKLSKSGVAATAGPGAASAGCGRMSSF